MNDYTPESLVASAPRTSMETTGQPEGGERITVAETPTPIVVNINFAAPIMVRRAMGDETTINLRDTSAPSERIDKDKTE